MILRPFILLLLTLPVPGCTTVTDRVDLVEVNHYYDGEGRLQYSQLIFYDFRADSRYDIVDWRMLKHPAQRPRRDPDRGDWVVIYQDAGTIRRIRARTRAETWFQFDPELVHRQYLPKDQRRGLSEIKNLKSQISP